jgi:hypothetical protein
MPYKPTASLPILWRSQLVQTATVDPELVFLLNKRNWHLSNTERPATPKTTVVVSKRIYHLMLSRVVFVLSKFQDEERELLWEDVSRLYEYSRRVPDISFFNMNPFDCTIDNLKLKGTNSPAKNVTVDFESKMTLPLKALFPASGLSQSSQTELSEPVVEALSEIQKAPTIVEIQTAGLENDPNVISEMFHALEEDTLGGANGTSA